MFCSCTKPPPAHCPAHHTRSVLWWCVHALTLFCCPVSGHVLEEPVINKNTGQIFEKRLIEKSIQVLHVESGAADSLCRVSLPGLRRCYR